MYQEKDEPQLRESEESSKDPKNIREQPLKARLELSSIPTRFGGDEIKWITDSAIAKTVTVESVTTALEELHKHDRALKLANGVVNGGYRKIFAILVLLGKEASIERLMAESIRDSNLPLKLETPATGRPLMRVKDGSPLSSFSDWDDEELKRFHSTQWSLLPPFFTFPKASDDLLQVSNFDSNSVLPFVEDTSSSPSEGAFGQVYKVKIAPGHWSDRHVGSRFRGLSCTHVMTG